jgi:hypothetical protein
MMRLNFKSLNWLLLIALAALAGINRQALAVPNDANLVDDDYKLILQMQYKRGGLLYFLFEPDGVVYIETNNANFVDAHASVGAGAGLKKLRHRHARWDYKVENVEDPPAVPRENWPTQTEGREFWDDTYAGIRDGQGGLPTTKSNCISHAFQGNVTHWVESNQAEEAWKKLPNCIHGDGDDCKQKKGGDFVHITDGDKAGFNNHAWILKRSATAAAAGPGAATGIEWKNNNSGVYTCSWPKPEGKIQPKKESNCALFVFHKNVGDRVDNVQQVQPNAPGWINEFRIKN